MRPFEATALASGRLQSRRIIRSCPRSQAVLGIDLLEFLLNDAVNFRRFFAEMAKLAEPGHPGLFRCLSTSHKLVFDRFGDKLPERNSTLGSRGFRSAEDKVRNFEGRLYASMFPYLWATDKKPVGHKG